MANPKIGTTATETTKTVWPEETLAGRPFDPHHPQRNWSRCGISATEFVVIPFGMATHEVEAALAALQPGKSTKAKSDT